METVSHTRKMLLLLAVCFALALVLPVTGRSDQGAGMTSAAARMTLQRVDGGPRWYGRFSNPFPTAPSFFPIGVWFESVTSRADIAKDMRAGLNTYVVLTSDSNLRLIESNGMRVIAQHGEWTARAGASGAQAIAGWELADEIDMQLGPAQRASRSCSGSWPACRRMAACVTTTTARV